VRGNKAGKKKREVLLLSHVRRVERPTCHSATSSDAWNPERDEEKKKEKQDPRLSFDLDESRRDGGGKNINPQVMQDRRGPGGRKKEGKTVPLPPTIRENLGGMR